MLAAGAYSWRGLTRGGAYSRGGGLLVASTNAPH